MEDETPSIDGNFVQLDDFELKAELIEILPLAVCHLYNIVVLEKSITNDGFHTQYTVGIADILCDKKPVMLEYMLKAPFKLVQLNQSDIHRALAVAYGNNEFDSSADHNIDLINYDNTPVSSVSGAIELVDQLLIDAIVHGASDIHIESYLDNTDVRYRVNGILCQVFTHIGANNIANVVNRLRVLAGLDISQQNYPQDGRFCCDFWDEDLKSRVDFRINVLPGPTGKDVAIRVLDKNVIDFEISQLGMSEKVENLLKLVIDNPEGLLLVAGPTGSGKTTTLYSALNEIKNKGKKIITAEDPIEYFIDKINQKQVSDHVSMADLSRSFLRHDPDVILIGEIRDTETAENAVRATLSGHLVLSTLHAADAIHVFQRLRGFGLQDDELASAILGIMAQRLVRRLCDNCRVKSEINKKHRMVLGSLAEKIQNHSASGCDECGHSGYKGRVGIYEFLLMNEKLQNMIYQGDNIEELKLSARQVGFQVMLEDAFEKINCGITSVDELFRVVPYRQIRSGLSELQRII